MSIQVLKPPMSALQSFGQSLSEGFQKNFAENLKSGSVAGGLKKLSEQSESLTPLEVYQKLWSIPGMDTQIASQAQPFLKTMGETSSRLARGKQGESSAVGTVENIPVSEPRGEVSTRVEKKGLPVGEPLRETAAIPQQTQIPDNTFFNTARSNDQLMSAAAEEVKQTGGNLQTSYEQLVQDEPGRVERNKQSLENVLNRVRSDLGVDEKKPLREDIGSVYLNKIEDELATIAASTQGAIDTNTINRVAEDVTEFAKMRNGMGAQGRDLVLGKDSAKSVSDQNADTRYQYAKRGLLEQGVDDLVTKKGYSVPMASLQMMPLSNPVKNSMPKKIPITKRDPFNIKGRDNPKVIDKVARALTPSDSVLAGGFELQRLGYDPMQYLDRVTELQNKGEINLTPYQQRERFKIPNTFFRDGKFKLTLSDYLIEAYMDIE